MKMNRWARAALLTGAIMTGGGLIPITVAIVWLPGLSPVGPIQLFLMLVPLGGLILLIGITLWLIAYLRR
jgi:hypothetical protein